MESPHHCCLSHNPGGAADKCFIYVFVLLFCLWSRAIASKKSCWEHRKPSSAQVSIFIVSGWLQRVSAPWIKIKVMSSSMHCFCCTHSWSWFDFFLNFKSFFNMKLSCFELCLGLPQALLWNRSSISRPTPTRCSATSYKFWRCPCSPWSCPSTAGFPTFPNDTYLACESRQLTF